MANRKALPRVTEPDTGLVHFAPHAYADQVTLCGLTDWLGATAGKPTRAEVTCNGCKAIVRHIHGHAVPPEAAHG